MADNRAIVLDLIRDNGPITRREIQRLSGLGHTTVAGIIDRLRSQGAIVDVVPDQTGIRRAGGRPPTRTGMREASGRPATRVALNPDLARLVGIQFEHTHIRAAITDLGLGLLREELHPMDVSKEPASALEAGAEIILDLIRSVGAPSRRVVGVAMALAAPVNTSAGVVQITRALRDWVGLRPGADLSRRLGGLPVVAANDATLAGFGEAVIGAGQGSRHVLYLKLSASIGCGIVIDGVPYTGATGTAGELAHVVVDDRGDLCFCGNRGCLWRLIGAERILNDL